MTTLPIPEFSQSTVVGLPSTRSTIFGHERRMSDIFLSYSTQNRPFILKLKKDLEALNYSVWVDNHHIKGGDEWVHEIETNLEQSKIVVVGVSETSNVSKWVHRETIRAEQLGKKRIPLLLDKSELPLHMLDLQYINFRESYEDGLKELSAILEKEHLHDPTPPSNREIQELRKKLEVAQQTIHSQFLEISQLQDKLKLADSKCQAQADPASLDPASLGFKEFENAFRMEIVQAIIEASKQGEMESSISKWSNRIERAMKRIGNRRNVASSSKTLKDTTVVATPTTAQPVLAGLTTLKSSESSGKLMDDISLGMSVASSTYGDDRCEVEKLRTKDPYGDYGIYTGTIHGAGAAGSSRSRHRTGRRRLGCPL